MRPDSGTHGIVIQNVQTLPRWRGGQARVDQTSKQTHNGHTNKHKIRKSSAIQTSNSAQRIREAKRSHPRKSKAIRKTPKLNRKVNGNILF